MRLDKFLKISRIIKRRSVAKEVANSSSTVKIGDVLTIQVGNKTMEIKVSELHESTKKEDAANMYEIIAENRNE